MLFLLLAVDKKIQCKDNLLYMLILFCLLLTLTSRVTNNKFCSSFAFHVKFKKYKRPTYFSIGDNDKNMVHYLNEQTCYKHCK